MKTLLIVLSVFTLYSCEKCYECKETTVRKFYSYGNEVTSQKTTSERNFNQCDVTNKELQKITTPTETKEEISDYKYWLVTTSCQCFED